MRRRPHHSRLLPLLFALGAFCATALAQPLAPDPSVRGEVGGGEDCADGVVSDDGSAETGYGWVPSVIEGEYVQEFSSSDFASRRLESVCICWIRTMPDATIDFEIVFYAGEIVDGEAAPAAVPYAAVPASAEVVPVGITESFFEVDVTGVMIPHGKSFIGARWDASSDQFFFICADHEDPAPPDAVARDPVAGDPVEVFFRDDRSHGEWTSVFDTSDPIFVGHRAMLVRARPGPAIPVEVPALGAAGLAALAAALAILALTAVRRGGLSLVRAGSRPDTRPHVPRDPRIRIG